MSKRKVVQISTIVEETLGEMHTTVVFALCNDGSIWVRAGAEAGAKWQPLPPVPQTQLPKEV